MARTAEVAQQPNVVLRWFRDRWTTIRNFLHDVRSEMRKVVTPSRTQVQATTTVVIVTVFLFAAYFGVIDWLLSRALGTILH